MVNKEHLTQGESIVDSGDIPSLRAFVSQHRAMASVLLRRSAFSLESADGGFGPNRRAVVETLLELGADMNYQQSYEYGYGRDTPLHTTASFNAVEVAQLLLAAGADVNRPGSLFDQGTPLAYASFFGFPEIADLLMNHGAIIYNLALAAGAGSLERVQDFLGEDGLLRADAAVTHPIDEIPDVSTFEDAQYVIQRAFQVAVLGGRADVADYFLKHSTVDVNGQIGVEYSGTQWIHLKAEKGNSGRIDGPLLKHAVLREYGDIIELLEQHGGKWDHPK